MVRFVSVVWQQAVWIGPTATKEEVGGPEIVNCKTVSSGSRKEYSVLEVCAHGGGGPIALWKQNKQEEKGKKKEYWTGFVSVVWGN